MSSESLKSLLAVQIAVFLSFLFYNATFFNLFNTNLTTTEKIKSNTSNLIDLTGFNASTFPHKNGKNY